MEGEDYGMKNKNKQKRFSDDQIRSLESMFESRTKLEPRVKTELARELGLQPRQVAIWFQNRRARWKSKQIEQDYKVLKANYDNLHSQFQALKMERQSLHIEVQPYNQMIKLLEKAKLVQLRCSWKHIPVFGFCLRHVNISFPFKDNSGRKNNCRCCKSSTNHWN